jgi:hypothetical protein
MFAGDEQTTTDCCGIKLDDDEDTAGSKSPACLGQRPTSIRDVMQRVDNEDGVDARISDGEC